MSKSIVVEGKRWIPSLQRWSWIVTILWMTVANIWKPFGLFGFVCMLTPIITALALLSSILLRPRTWCTICPMVFPPRTYAS